jgi:hypothetical protein
MEVWPLVLYGLAAFLAFRSLAALMTQHKSRLLKKVVADEERLQREAQVKSKAEKGTQPKKNGKPTNGRAAAHSPPR